MYDGSATKALHPAPLAWRKTRTRSFASAILDVSAAHQLLSTRASVGSHVSVRDCQGHGDSTDSLPIRLFFVTSPPGFVFWIFFCDPLGVLSRTLVNTSCAFSIYAMKRRVVLTLL